jgi:hypothetical protein
MARIGLSVAQRLLSGSDTSRRLRLGIRQVGLVVSQRRLCKVDAGLRLGLCRA